MHLYTVNIKLNEYIKYIRVFYILYVFIYTITYLSLLERKSNREMLKRLEIIRV